MDEIERRHEQMAGTEAEAFLQAGAEAPEEPPAEPALPDAGAKVVSWQEARAASAAVGLGPAAAQTWEMVNAAAAQANRSRQQAEAFEYLRALVEGDLVYTERSAAVAREVAGIRAKMVAATKAQLAATRDSLRDQADVAAMLADIQGGTPVAPPGDSLRNQADVAAMFLADTHGVRDRSRSPPPPRAHRELATPERFVLPDWAKK